MTSSPYINHFLQPDTITPGGPQGLNRFSYVVNNPINAIDPSGHKCVGEAAECLNDDGSKGKGFSGGNSKPRVKPESGCGAPGQKRCDGGDPAYGNGLVGAPDHSCHTESCWIDNPPILYCGGGKKILSNILDCGATVTQDLAFAFDVPFAGVEIALIAVGCYGGGLSGCAAGQKAGVVFFNFSGGNAIEMALSNTSAGLSVAADATTNGITHIGESSATAIAGAVAGNLSPDPILDLFIDGYGAGYDHEIFNGVYSFFTSDPVIR